MNIRQIIKGRMRDLKVTQLELEERTGIVQPQISAFLSGKRSAVVETVERLLDALDLEIRPAPRRRKGT